MKVSRDRERFESAESSLDLVRTTVGPKFPSASHSVSARNETTSVADCDGGRFIHRARNTRKERGKSSKTRYVSDRTLDRMEGAS